MDERYIQNLDNWRGFYEKNSNTDRLRKALKGYYDLAAVLCPLAPDAIDPGPCIINDAWIVNLKKQRENMENIDLTEEMKELLTTYKSNLDECNHELVPYTHYAVREMRRFIEVYEKKQEYEAKLSSLMKKLNIKESGQTQ